MCSVESLAIALEPHSRLTHCSFCSAGGIIKLCKSCGLVGVCADCDRARAMEWHRTTECHQLEQLSCGGQQADDISAVVLLVARLLLRRRHEDRLRKRKRSTTLDEYAVLDLLETHHASLDVDTAAAMRAAGDGLQSLLGCAAPELADPRRQPLHVLLACACNFHGIVDLAQPLGEQQIGVALFPTIGANVNHACAPNAFLSTAPLSSRRAVVASLRCLHDLEAGQAVTISYISLGGVPSACRAERLLASYHFRCGCYACTEPVRSALDSRMGVSDEPAEVAEVQQAAHAQLLSASQRPGTTCELSRTLVVAASRAVAFHKLGAAHGYHMESRRLEAWLASNEKRHEQSAQASEAWLAAAETLRVHDGCSNAGSAATSTIFGATLADPLAIVNQRVQLAAALEACGRDDEAAEQMSTARREAEVCLGQAHPFLRSTFGYAGSG